MSAADDIYDAAIKDLAARARNMGRIEDADCSHDADNFLCGDRVTVEVALNGDAIENIGGKVRGCMLVQAAAAVIHGAAPGKDRAVLADGIAQARALLSDGTPATGDWEGLNAFTPVQGHKHRHDCVLLPFEAVEACLADTDGTD